MGTTGKVGYLGYMLNDLRVVLLLLVIIGIIFMMIKNFFELKLKKGVRKKIGFFKVVMGSKGLSPKTKMIVKDKNKGNLYKVTGFLGEIKEIKKI